MQFSPSKHQLQADGNFSETSTERVQLNGSVREMEMMQKVMENTIEGNCLFIRLQTFVFFLCLPAETNNIYA